MKKPLTGLYAFPWLLYTASYKTFIGVSLPIVSSRLLYMLKAAIGFTNGLRSLSRKERVKIYKSFLMHQYQCNSRGILKNQTIAAVIWLKCCLYSVQQKHIYQSITKLLITYLSWTETIYLLLLVFFVGFFCFFF